MSQRGSTGKAMKSPEQDPAFDLWVLLQQTKDAVYNARDKELSKYSISPREAATLRAITLIGPKATQAMLARWVYRKPQTVLGILRRMQKKGLLKLTKDPDIINIVRITLTPKGKATYASARKRESLHTIFDTIDEKTFNQAKSFLTEIRDKALAVTGDTIRRPFP